MQVLNDKIEGLHFTYANVCNPIHLNSFGRNKFIFLFIDDFIRKTWVYFLKKKSEVFSAFKKFKALVEKESNHNIKALRSNKRSEFTSKEFEKYCENHGIHLYSPQKKSYS